MYACHWWMPHITCHSGGICRASLRANVFDALQLCELFLNFNIYFCQNFNFSLCKNCHLNIAIIFYIRWFILARSHLCYLVVRHTVHKFSIFFCIFRNIFAILAQIFPVAFLAHMSPPAISFNQKALSKKINKKIMYKYAI